MSDDRQTRAQQPQQKEAAEDGYSEEETWEDKEGIVPCTKQVVSHELWSPELGGVADASRADGAKLTYGRDFLLQFQTRPISMLRPEGLPDLEVVLGQARTPSRTPKPDGGENMFRPTYVRGENIGENMFHPTYMRGENIGENMFRPTYTHGENIGGNMFLPTYMRQESKMSNPTSSRSGFDRRREPPEDSESISLRLGRDREFSGAWASGSGRVTGAVNTGVGPSGTAGSATGGFLAKTDNTPTNRMQEIYDLKQFNADFKLMTSEGEDAFKMEEGNVLEEDLELADESKKPSDTEETVPSEILARGPLAMEAYKKALREGKTSLKRLPVMLIGQDRSGKTSLKKSLRGQRFNPNEASTIGIEKDPSHFQVTTEIWTTGEKGEEVASDAATSYEHHAAKLIVSSLMEEKQSTAEDVLEPILSESPSTDSSDHAPADNEFPTLLIGDLPSSAERFASKQHSKKEERALVHIQSGGLPNANKDSPVPRTEFVSVVSDKPTTILQDSESSDVHDSETPDSPRENGASLGDEAEVPHDIASLVEKLLQEGTKVEDDDIYSVLWDFGGQFVYYVTHPLFLTPKAIYVLVYDLSRDPCGKANPRLMQGMFKIFEDKFCLKTNFDYLDFWMTSVSSLTFQDEHEEIPSRSKYDVLPEKLPPVFFVCSHADKPYNGEDPRTLANDIFDSLQRRAYSNHLVERAFVVNNTLSGSELECPEVVQLRQHLLAVAKELPQMENVIPVKWLKYEKALDIAEKDGHKWISLDNAKKIAFEACKISDEQEFFTLLNFLHDQRIVIHFDDNPELDKFVVLDPQWLIDVFSKVITVKPYVFKERKYKELWSKLEETGILEETLLEHVWSPFLDNKETSDSLIAMMEKFSLLCPWPSSDASCCKQYLVPSMLTSHPPEDIMKLVSSAQVPPLFFKFESGHVPSGLFPRLLLQFFQWGKDEFWSSVNPHLFLNFARFYTSGDEDCSVVLLCHSSSFEVIVHRGNSGIESAKCLESKVDVSADAHYDVFEVECACTVQRQLSLMLETMREEFCWLRNMRYKVGVICPVCCQGGVLNYCRTHHEQGCRRGECLHFLSESELRSAKHSISCTRSAAATNNKVYVKRFAPWFGSPTKQDSQRSVVKCGAGLLLSSTGNEEKAIVLPRKVVELLSWKSTDPKEIVLHLEQNLQVDQSFLRQPGPETKKLIRYVASKAKHLDRLDVVKHLRKITPAGTTGPLLPGKLDVRNIPVDKMRELTVDLSGGDEWKDVAERLGLTPKEIRFLDKRTRNPFEAVLAYISQQRYYINVDDLYDVLNDCGLPVLADLL